jgi:hypothetical protein
MNNEISPIIQVTGETNTDALDPEDGDAVEEE